MRKTKIICTLGPASESEEVIEKLILTGMDAARFNFSHGTHESHLALLTRVKNVRDRLGRPLATILDTKGPEIRIRSFASGKIELAEGDTFTLTTREVEGDNTIVSVTYANLHNEVSVGTHLLIDDGLVDIEVTEIKGQDIICRVVTGGPLSNNKSINIPNTHISLPALTEKDKGDLKFAVENDFDFVAASFVRQASDVEEIRAVLDSHGGQNIGIIAKIENQEGVDNLEEILRVADGLMVARGDLGVEIPAQDVPVIQKRMIKAAIAQGKHVVTATQMLDSMIRNPRPTRAEVSDVANAVFDGTGCVMLSGETASGKHPVEALKTMVDIVTTAENATNYWKRFRKSTVDHTSSITDAISHTACLTAMDLKAAAILTATETGHTARMTTRYRPGCLVVALTTNERVRRQLAITWGVAPFLSGTVDSTDRLFSLCVESAKKEGVVQEGDTVVITAGVPIGKSGSTNLIKAQVVK
ncbi:pyruvate kinase [Pseudoflavonifractor capillosus]|uniref:pyruvate kinase n=1 Tax=Pseudoflavonifractor capillosus TaxID=106588 RepID=UPI0019569A56|nr:pyruvate kinase [Pseudoflavonifractor capillosus]MBM6896843.1 pyruvate kinase [Pseudoflavonifractor capillosus]